MPWFIATAIATITIFYNSTTITVLSIIMLTILLLGYYNKKGLKCFMALCFVVLLIAIRFNYVEHQKEEWLKVREQPDTLTIQAVKTIDGYTGKIIDSKNHNINRGSINIYLDDEIKSGSIVKHTGKVNTSKQYNNFYVPYEYSYINDYVGYITQHTGSIEIKEATPALYHKINDVMISRANKVLNKLSEESRGLVQGIFFGSKTNISNTDHTSLLDAGLVHITAVSGFHVGIVFYMFFSLSALFFKDKDKRYLVGLLFTILFVIFVGFKASTLRALIMITIFTLSKILGYPYSLTRSIALTFIVSIIINPFLIYDMGFQFSYLGVLGIALFHSKITFLDWIPNEFLVNILKATIAVQITTFPLNIYYNGGFPLLSPLANLLTTPAMPLIFGALLFSMAFPISPVITLIDLLAKWILFVANIYGRWQPISVEFMLCVIFVAILLHIGLRFKEYKKYCITFAFGISMTFLIYTCIPTIHLHFIDVGQGDCILITDNRNNILVDTGGNINYDVGNRAVIPTLKRLGVTQLDFVFITHAHYDHGGAIAELAKQIPIKNIVVPDNNFFKGGTADLVFSTAKQHQINVISIEKGTKITFSEELKFNTLHPRTNFLPSESQLNNISLVFEGSLFDTQILLTGDVERQGEEVIAPLLGEADILKVAHHGSLTSTSKEIVKFTSPKYAIITVGENSFGHPSNDVIKRLENNGSEVLRTDKHGRIFFTIRPWGYKLDTVLR
ncbi:DNA internalization-related competence protein ComEC/Rec2 [Proteinivorax hydrogeniformans]|uniref:DNA internalization-related competence protein ComEC/Rec2 n=1 Tax=Proteinivorax hydrogeniformans TaxID=1826727 RepID=A0AAU8HWJ6_9FIRM